MNTKYYLLALGVFALLGFGFTNGPEKKRNVNNDAFDFGESLEYRVHYGAVTAGTAVLEVQKKPVEVGGRECYHMVGKGISSKSFSVFYRVNDRYETFVDIESLAPMKFKRRIEEGSFKSYTEVKFDHQKQKAYERRTGHPDIATYDVPQFIQDVLSAFYFARTQDYDNAKPGDITHFENFIDQAVHNLDVEFLGREVLEVGGVKYKTVKLQPLLEEGGIFRHEGDFFLWISDDKNRIPVRVESGLVIGSIQVDLKSAKGLKHPMTSRTR